MHCELLVPGLLAFAEPPRVAALELLLARSRVSRSSGQPLERWLQQAFDLPRLPAGALTALSEGVDPGGAQWARADPVHLRLLRDRAVIAPAAAFALSVDEARALVESLNAHFGGRLEFHLHTPDRWSVRLDAPLALASGMPDSPAFEVAGRAAGPVGPVDALLTEAQMVLHEHPVNAAREARGEPAVNSVWLWGEGEAPPATTARWHSVTADDPLARGLARAAQLRTRPGTGGTEWLDRAPEEGRHLVVLDSLRPHAALGDATGFAAALEALESAWFVPLLGALRAGRIGMATLHVPDAGLAAEAIRGDLRRIWRRPKPLSRWAKVAP